MNNITHKLRQILAVAILTSFAFAGVSFAKDAEKAKTYEVSAIKLNYAKPNEAYPDIAVLNQTRVPLKKKGDIYAANSEKGVQRTVNIFRFEEGSQFTVGALNDIMLAVVSELNAMGYDGVYVLPDSAYLDIKTGEDKRVDTKELALNVWLAEIAVVKTVAKGSRIDSDDEELVNNSTHSRILGNSPVVAEEGKSTTLNKEVVSDYVRRLNRHPNRRVDSSVASSYNTGEVDLDYLVKEDKSWMAYAQVSNTGTDSTGKNRYRFGFTDFQFTGNDDIFTLDYLDSFEETRAAMVSYQIPLMFPDYLKMRVYGSYSDYTARDVGNAFLDYTGTNYIGGIEFTASPFNLGGGISLDFIAGFRYENIEVNNITYSQKGNADLYIPYLGVYAERRGGLVNTRASVFAETNLSNISEADMNALGRLYADDQYVVLKGDFVHSFYIEPLLRGESFYDTSDWTNSIFANELYFRARGQYTLDDKRLISQQEFISGGLYSVRGYPESVAAGDNGFVVNAEYRLHLPRLLAPYSALSEESRADRLSDDFNLRQPSPLSYADWDFILKVFFDYGRTYNNQQLFYESNYELMSWGVGAEVQLSKYITARVDWGYILKGLTQYSSSAVEDAQVGDNKISFVITVSY